MPYGVKVDIEKPETEGLCEIAKLLKERYADSIDDLWLTETNGNRDKYGRFCHWGLEILVKDDKSDAQHLAKLSIK